MKFCIRKSAALSHMLLQPGESTHFLCSSKNQHRNQMIHFISIKSFTEPERHKQDLWLFRSYSVKKQNYFKNSIFLKLNANQIGPNLLSIYLVPLAIVPRNLIWLFSIYMYFLFAVFKNHSAQSFLIYSMSFDRPIGPILQLRILRSFEVSVVLHESKCLIF